MAQDSTGADSATATVPSRRRFLASAGATTAGVAISPMLAGSAPAAESPTPPSDRLDAAITKTTDLARETSVDAGQRLTSNVGVKVSDNQNQLKGGPRGPALLEDSIFREKITSFDHERIPERVVHARGAAARYAPSPSLSMIARGNPKAAAGRRVAILAADGVNADQVQAMKAALRQAGVIVKLLAPRLGDLQGVGGGRVPVDDLILTMPSVVFDAVFVPGGAGSVDALRNSADAVHFVREAFKHAKPISAQGQGVDLLVAAGVMVSATAAAKPTGLSTGEDSSVLSVSFIADIDQHRHWAREKLDMMAA